MTDKERLEDIKERFAKYQTDYNLNGEDVEWLIQQAERVQELESELNKQIEIGYKFEGEVYGLAKENKRYRKALNTIITSWIASTDATDDTWLAHEMSETARKALEVENNE